MSSSRKPRSSNRSTIRVDCLSARLTGGRLRVSPSILPTRSVGRGTGEAGGWGAACAAFAARPVQCALRPLRRLSAPPTDGAWPRDRTVGFLHLHEPVLTKISRRRNRKAGATNRDHTGRNRNTPNDIGETSTPSVGGNFDRNDTVSGLPRRPLNRRALMCIPHETHEPRPLFHGKPQNTHNEMRVQC